MSLDKGFKIALYATVIIGRLRVPWTVNGGGCGHDLSPLRKSNRRIIDLFYSHFSSQGLMHLCFFSHHEYPALPMHPCLSLSPPKSGFCFCSQAGKIKKIKIINAYFFILFSALAHSLHFSWLDKALLPDKWNIGKFRLSVNYFFPTICCVGMWCLRTVIL